MDAGVRARGVVRYQINSPSFERTKVRNLFETGHHFAAS
jgi:hypothetical protein